MNPWVRGFSPRATRARTQLDGISSPVRMKHCIAAIVGQPAAIGEIRGKIEKSVPTRSTKSERKDEQAAPRPGWQPPWQRGPGFVPQGRRNGAGQPEQNHSRRSLVRSIQCGFISTPTSKNRSPGTPERKKPLGGRASGIHLLGFRYRRVRTANAALRKL